MEALILSCGTGGGHDSAAQAIAEQMKDNGYNVSFMDPFSLAGNNVASVVSNVYIKIVQKAPHLFGGIYLLGNIVRRIPVYSPVYWANSKAAVYVREYLSHNKFDVIIMSHLFPAEIMTYLKNIGIKLPLTVFIATDYTCIPFTEETSCDFYVIPSSHLKKEFEGRGVSPKRLLTFGIPVEKSFSQIENKSEILRRLGLDKRKKYLLLAGGSIGAGGLTSAITEVMNYLRIHKNYILIIICGNNKKLYNILKNKYRNNTQVSIIGHTDRMADYIKICEVYLSKPGGLSSTEAAVIGTPLIHISPIPGCENHNVKFFASHGMSLEVNKEEKCLTSALRYLEKKENSERMINRQRKYINRRAAEDIYRFIDNYLKSKKSKNVSI